MIGSFHKFYTAEEIANFFTKNGDDKRYFVTIGLRNQDEEIEKLKALKDFDFSVLIDVPNAYIPAVEDLVKLVRKTCPERIIAVGNVCTGERTQELIKAGANIIKTGVGPSAVCKTRFTAGNGRPQLSTILDCANAAHQVGGYIIADGGFKYTADFNKAFVAGADFCMSGSFFAGCDEAAGEVIEKLYRTDEYDYNINEDTNEVFPLKPKYELKKFKEYYGMSSFRAQKENYGKITDSGTSEGVESKLIPYTGSIEKTIKDIQGSLRSCGSYIGSTNIKNFPRQGSFYRVNRQQ
jgi:GMP reductase